MALIYTPYGDIDLPASMKQSFMDGATVTFDVPLSDALVTAGAFNVWQPIAVRWQDGNSRDGGSQIELACWVTDLKRTDQTVTVTAQDGNVWMQRRYARRVSSVTQPAGAHLLDIFANIIDDREERPAQSYIPGIPNSPYGAWPNPNAGATPLSERSWGTTWETAAAVDNSHSATYRQATFGLPAFSTSAVPTSVKLRLFTQETAGVIWSNTVEISVDGGSTWDAAHTVPAQGAIHETKINLTADHSWIAADLASILVRCTVQADADYAGTWTSRVDDNGVTIDHITWDGPGWSIYYIGIQIDFASGIQDRWPLVASGISQGGPAIALPANELKSFRGWLDHVGEQTGYEWAISSNYNLLDSAGIVWRQRIGSALAATITIDGVSRQVASLDEGSTIGGAPQVELDGLNIFSRVRVTASGLSDVVQTNTTLAAAIGTHENVIDLGSNATAADQAATASTQLAVLGAPALTAKIVVRRIPGLWSSLTPGNTSLTWLAHAPLTAWQGVARFLSWQIDDAAGTVTLDIISIQDSAGSSLPVAATGTSVQAPVWARRATPDNRRLALLKQILELARRGAR